LKLSGYNKSECIFIDANIFLDYSLPDPKYGESAADFLEKIELNEVKAVILLLFLTKFHL